MSDSGFFIARRRLGGDAPAYFIADISANHDGSLQRARTLIRLAAEAGANAAKFQNFRASKIVSRHGFEAMGTQRSHQASWRKSVFEVYEDASLPWQWTESLARECRDAGIDYLSTPYDLEAVDMLDPFVPAYKIGSGDITWPEMLEKVASKGKPVLIAAGASHFEDVDRAMRILLAKARGVALLQCNTNYTGSDENFRHIHLNVLRTFASAYPHAILGLSDHTSGHATVLGAVALGARVIEKHFTDDPAREGPDHGFSMTPATWRDMVDRTRELEAALGSCEKFMAENERDTVVVQRRSLRASRNLAAGEIITRDMIDVLRPAPPGALLPYEIGNLLGRTLTANVEAGDCFRASALSPVKEEAHAGSLL
ncbi:MAG: N-acetylneuraminate synthase family protein [Bryobacteraceae bacterium]